MKSNQKIGVLTAYENGMTEHLLKSCGISNLDDIVITDLSNLTEFSAILENRGTFDNEKLRYEVVTAAINLVNSNCNVGKNMKSVLIKNEFFVSYWLIWIVLLLYMNVKYGNTIFIVPHERLHLIGIVFYIIQSGKLLVYFLWRTGRPPGEPDSCQ